MREKIVEIIKNAEADCCDPCLAGEVTDCGASDSTNQILSLIRGKVQEVENPCLYQRDKEGAEAMRQKILSILV